MSQVLSLWQKCTSIPLVGARVFSFAFGQKAPYFSSIRPRFTVIEPNHAELVIPDRRRVHNHLGTVHAIALCNGLEAAMGALAEVTIPETKRWIPKGMTVSYTAKAIGDITCIAETDAAQWTSSDPNLPVQVRGVDADGTVVIEGVINLWVTEKRADLKAAAASWTQRLPPCPGRDATRAPSRVVRNARCERRATREPRRPGPRRAGEQVEPPRRPACRRRSSPR